MEVYAASRRDLANAIQSYNDNDSITFISVAKVQQNSEITKLSSKKELPPVTPLGTNRRGISKAA